ncbi:MAG: ABC-2 transporter permease, partial [bacterium]|nr:ABC-2 transporter permease [bacterium]
MMKRVLTHVIKDFKHLKYQFMLWLLLLICQIVSTELEWLAWSTPYMGIQLKVFLRGLILFIWIPQLIQADTITGTSAFWTTRPVSGKEMFSAKALYIFLFIICTAVMANSIYPGLKGSTPVDIFWSDLKMISDIALIVLPLWLLAALTATFKNYILTMIVITFVPGGALFVYRLIHEDVISSLSWIFSLLQILLFGGLLLHQYVTRKTRKTVYFTIAALIVFYALFIWNFSSSMGDHQNEWPRSSSSGPGSTDISQATFAFEAPALAPDDPRIRDFKVSPRARNSGGIGTRNDGKGKLYSIFYRADYSGIPKGCFITLRAKKDVVVQYSGTRMQAPALLLLGSTSPIYKSQALRDMFKAPNPTGKSPELSSTEFTFELRGIPEESLRRFCPAVGTLTAPIELDLWEYEIICRVPLKKGSRYKKESDYLEITDLELSPSDCSVSVEIQAKTNYFLGKTVSILFNKKRGEMLTSRSGNEQYAREGGTVKISRGMSFSPKALPNLKTIDRAWVKDAEFIYLKPKIIGRVSKSLRVEKLLTTMSNYIWSFLKTKQVELNRITLPENADVIQVEEYIRDVLTIAVDNRSLGKKDIEIDMLAKVGPEHIELLARMGILYESKGYTREAIKRIAGPGNKKQILNILEDYNGLFSIVCSEGWHEDVKAILIEKLEKGEGRDYLIAWVQNGCPRLDLSLFPRLKRSLLEMDSKELEKWSAALSGMDISDILPHVWERCKNGDDHLVAEILPPVMAAGLP